MEREIKFRVWDKGLKVWRTDCLLMKNGSLWFNDSGRLASLEQDAFDVVPYTGLKDKNGVEIYEGDVVQKGHWRYGLDEHNRIWGTVSFRSDESGAFYAIEPFQRGDRKDWDNGTGWGMSSEIDNKLHGESSLLEVIGNRYENPELLEGGE